MEKLSQEEYKDIDLAVACMRRGGVIVYPSDTVWGIGCDARNDMAVEKVYALKGRAEAKAVISLVGDKAMLAALTGSEAVDEETLAKGSDRPLTVIYPDVKGLSPHVIAEDGSAAIRLTREFWSAELCRCAGFPLVSTSANISGEKAPSSFGEISEAIISGADYVCTSRRSGSGACAGAVPSRIVKILPGGGIHVIRE